MAELVKYQTDGGTIVEVRLSDEVAAIAGTQPAGASTGLIVNACHSSSRKSQLRARGVRLRRLFGSVTVGDQTRPLFEYANITCLTQARQTALRAEATVTYNGQTWTPVSRIAEG